MSGVARVRSFRLRLLAELHAKRTYFSRRFSFSPKILFPLSSTGFHERSFVFVRSLISRSKKHKQARASGPCRKLTQRATVGPTTRSKNPPPLVQMAVRMAAPHNNQGKFGTCCGHAFSTVVVNGIVASMASSLYIEQAHLFAKVETLCDCWEGHDPLAMCEEWNGVSGKKEAWVPTLEKKEAYQIKVEHGGKITSFDKAHDTMKTVHDWRDHHERGWTRVARGLHPVR